MIIPLHPYIFFTPDIFLDWGYYYKSLRIILLKYFKFHMGTVILLCFLKEYALHDFKDLRCWKNSLTALLYYKGL